MLHQLIDFPYFPSVDLELQEWLLYRKGKLR